MKGRSRGEVVELTFEYKWYSHVTVVSTLQTGVKINICYLQNRHGKTHMKCSTRVKVTKVCDQLHKSRLLKLHES